MRKVKTASGATAVQIASKTRGVRTIVEHLRDVVISIDGHQLTAETPAAGEGAEILAKLRSAAGH